MSVGPSGSSRRAIVNGKVTGFVAVSRIDSARIGVRLGRFRLFLGKAVVGFNSVMVSGYAIGGRASTSAFANRRGLAFSKSTTTLNAYTAAMRKAIRDKTLAVGVGMGMTALRRAMGIACSKIGRIRRSNGGWFCL